MTTARELPFMPVQMREVWLHGRLRKKYGRPFRLAVRSATEAIRALCVQIKGLRADIRSMDFWVVYGDLRRGVKLPLEAVDIGLGVRDLHFYPIPQGAKSGSFGGVLKIVVGAALVAASFFIPVAGAGFVGGLLSAAHSLTLGLGAALFLGGVSSLISPHPQTNTSQQTTASYVFQGPSNVTPQGVAIPLCYGTCLAGSVVVAASLSNSDILDGQVGTTSKLGQVFGLST